MSLDLESPHPKGYAYIVSIGKKRGIIIANHLFLTEPFRYYMLSRFNI